MTRIQELVPDIVARPSFDSSDASKLFFKPLLSYARVAKDLQPHQALHFDTFALINDRVHSVDQSTVRWSLTSGRIKDYLNAMSRSNIFHLEEKNRL